MRQLHTMHHNNCACAAWQANPHAWLRRRLIDHRDPGQILRSPSCARPDPAQQQPWGWSGRRAVPQAPARCRASWQRPRRWSSCWQDSQQEKLGSFRSSRRRHRQSLRTFRRRLNLRRRPPVGCVGPCSIPRPARCISSRNMCRAVDRGLHFVLLGIDQLVCHVLLAGPTGILRAQVLRRGPRSVLCSANESVHPSAEGARTSVPCLLRGLLVARRWPTTCCPTARLCGPMHTTNTARDTSSCCQAAGGYDPTAAVQPNPVPLNENIGFYLETRICSNADATFASKASCVTPVQTSQIVLCKVTSSSLSTA